MMLSTVLTLPSGAPAGSWPGHQRGSRSTSQDRVSGSPRSVIPVVSALGFGAFGDQFSIDFPVEGDHARVRRHAPCGGHCAAHSVRLLPSIEEIPSMRSMLKRATFTTTARPVGLDWPPMGLLNRSCWSVRVGASVYKRKDDCGV